MDVLNMQKAVERLLKKTDEEQKQSLRKLIKMPLEGRVKVLEINRGIFYPLREMNKDLDVSLLSYISLIKSVEKYQENTNDLDRNVVELRSKSIRIHPKRDKVIGYWALIKELKNKGLSYRKIAAYLKKYHKLEVVHSTIYDLWNELEVDKKEGK